MSGSRTLCGSAEAKLISRDAVMLVFEVTWLALFVAGLHAGTHVRSGPTADL